MDDYTVMVFPVANPAGWREFAIDVANGERAEAHQQFLSRVGVRRETNFLQQIGPEQFVIVAIWDGIAPARAQIAMQQLVDAPQSPHEEYVAHVVVPSLHGVQESDWVAPAIELVSVIEAS